MGYRKITAISCMAALALMIPAAVMAADYEDTVEKSFKVRNGGTLEVSSDIGSIRVRTGDTDTAEITVLREFDTPRNVTVDDILEDFDITMEQRGNNVIVEVESNWDWGWNRGRNNGRLNVEIEVSIPEIFNVDLETAGGSITVGDLDGEVECNTAGGSISLGVIDGIVKAETAGGSISVESTSADAELRTAGGGITIGDAGGDVNANTAGGSINVGRAEGDVNVHTAGGSITVREVTGIIDASTSGGSVTAYISGQPSGDCKMTTSGGSVKVYVNPEARLSIDAQTTGRGGRIRASGIPVQLGDRDTRALVADMNGGGPELYLRTSGGDVRIDAK